MGARLKPLRKLQEHPCDDWPASLLHSQPPPVPENKSSSAKWKHDAATGRACKVHRSCAVHARTAKGKRPAMHPNHRPFVVFFPRDFRPTPSRFQTLVKLPAPRAWIQSRRQFNGLSDLLGFGLRNIPSKHPSRMMRTFKPRALGPPFRGEPLGDGRWRAFSPTHGCVDAGAAYTGWRLAVPSLCGLCS